MPDVTEDERAKRVVDGAGDEIGIVDHVRDGTAYVDPDDDVGNETRTKLGWGGETKTTYPLRNDAIDEVTDEAIRLRDEYAG